jgi:hypothetical protein
VHDATAARVVRRNLDEAGVANATVIVVTDALRLPLADGSAGAACFEDAAASALGISARGFDRFAAELARVVRPGGTVFLGLANRAQRRLGVERLRASLQAKQNPESLNRQLKREGAPPGPLPGLHSVVRAMRRHGFGAPRIYAPLPDERRTQVVIPTDEPGVARYFLNRLLRRDSRRMRAAVAGARVLSGAGLLRAAVPYWFLYFTAGERP